MSGACAAAALGAGSGAIDATVSPPFVTAYGNSGAMASLTTGAAVVTVSGAFGTPTFAWSQVGSSPYTWTIGSPTAANTTFTATNVPAGVETVAEFQCVVTDATGAKATVSVEADANNGQPYSSYTPSGGSGSGLLQQSNK